MARAAEIMNPHVVSTRPDDKVESVIKILTENNISGLPVVDEENCVIGVITERDLLVYSHKLSMLPFNFAPFILPHSSFPAYMTVENKANIFLKTRIEEVMSRKVVTVNEDDTWRNVVTLMKKKTINRIPVVDSGGRLKGIITRNDLLNYFAEQEDF
ncbi:MAG: CBS domain-containing protein [Christensenellales bacterium]